MNQIPTWRAQCSIYDNESFQRQCMQDEINALRQRCAELESAQAWMPIESAPKDGSWIIVARPNGALHKVGPDYWMGSDIQDWAKSATGFKPTHWMPLPQPLVKQDKQDVEGHPV